MASRFRTMALCRAALLSFFSWLPLRCALSRANRSQKNVPSSRFTSTPPAAIASSRCGASTDPTSMAHSFWPLTVSSPGSLVCAAS